MFAGVLTAAFLGGVIYQHSLAAADPIDAVPVALSDRAKIPDHSVIRVQADLRLDTLTETTRGNTLLALQGVPDVIVFGSTDQAELAASGPSQRTLVGEMQPGDAEDIGGVIEKFAKGTLGLERSKVRILNVRIDAGARGAQVRGIVFSVLAGVFAVFTLLGLLRLRTLRERVRREDAGTTV